MHLTYRLAVSHQMMIQITAQSSVSTAVVRLIVQLSIQYSDFTNPLFRY